MRVSDTWECYAHILVGSRSFLDSSSARDEWIALVSGLQVGALSPADAQIELLTEFLTGELGGQSDQASSSQISRVIIAGNSLAAVVNTVGSVTEEEERKPVGGITTTIPSVRKMLT